MGGFHVNKKREGLSDMSSETQGSEWGTLVRPWATCPSILFNGDAKKVSQWWVWGGSVLCCEGGEVDDYPPLWGWGSRTSSGPLDCRWDKLPVLAEGQVRLQSSVIFFPQLKHDSGGVSSFLSCFILSLQCQCSSSFCGQKLVLEFSLQCKVVLEDNVLKIVLLSSFWSDV